MKISEDIKIEIQCFVYYFFKGTMASNQLLGADINYLKVVLADRHLLYNCFKVFAATQVDSMGFVDRERQVANYLVDLQRGDANAAYLNAQAHFTSSMHTPFWIAFLKLVYCFCNNSFPVPLTEDYVPGLDGCGTDAVPAFAVWTNVLEVDENQCPLNAADALKRANERLLLWDGKAANPPFAEWELEQEIY